MSPEPLQELLESGVFGANVLLLVVVVTGRGESQSRPALHHLIVITFQGRAAVPVERATGR